MVHPPLVLNRPTGQTNVFDGAFQWLDLGDRVALTFLGTRLRDERDDSLEGLIRDLGWFVRRVASASDCTWSMWMVTDDDRPITPLIDLSVLALWPFGTPEPTLVTPMGIFEPEQDVLHRNGDSTEIDAVDDTAIQSAPEDFVFEFQVPDGETTVFRCRAGAIDEALDWVQMAGYEDAVLLSRTAIPPSERTERARAAVMSDPILGPTWLPLVDALADELDSLPANRPRTVQTYAAKYWFDPHRSPYFQFLRQADGSVLAEVAGPRAESLQSPDWENRLRLLGWRMRGDRVDSMQSPLLREQLDSPNPTKRFDASQSGYTIVRNVLSMVVFSWEVDDQDLFNLTGYPEVFDNATGLERVEGKPMFRIDQKPSAE